MQSDGSGSVLSSLGEITPLRAGRCLVAFFVSACATLNGSLRPRSSTLKHVCLSVMYNVPWKAIWTSAEWAGCKECYY